MKWLIETFNTFCEFRGSLGVAGDNRSNCFICCHENAEYLHGINQECSKEICPKFLDKGANINITRVVKDEIVDQCIGEDEVKERPTWDEYFFNFVLLAEKRSTCIRRQVGAVLVRDNRIIATGYNGAPSGAKHCIEIGCMREQLKIPSGQNYELCRALHAEENCIIQCAVVGNSTIGVTMYTKVSPCSRCAKTIVGAGIKKLLYLTEYNDQLAYDTLKEGNVEIIQYTMSK